MPNYGGQPLKLLLVEDDPEDAELTRLSLREAGRFAVRHTVSLADAKRTLAEWQPEVILPEVILSDSFTPSILLLSWKKLCRLKISRRAFKGATFRGRLSGADFPERFMVSFCEAGATVQFMEEER